ncbi:hypothetical protein BAE44_0010823, partial [Dichanthelium oligosanthes]
LPSTCATPAVAAPSRPSCAGTSRKACSSSLARAPRRLGPGARLPTLLSMRPTAPSPLTPAMPCRSSLWLSPSTSRATVFPRCAPLTPPLPRCLPARSSRASEGTRSPSMSRSCSCYTATAGLIRPPRISVPASMASPTVTSLSRASLGETPTSAPSLASLPWRLTLAPPSVAPDPSAERRASLCSATAPRHLEALPHV